MRRPINRPTRIVAASVIGAFVLAGCQGGPPGVTPSTSPSAVASSGAKLWADNCSRCHYVRPPGSYSDSQWETVVHHMRLRAHLTGPEQRAITAFLKASN